MRGVIIHEERAKQLRDFSGLRIGTITPSDLDAYIEYHDKLWVIMEFKFEDAEMGRGQRIGMARMCRDLSSKKPVLGILASHDQPSSQPIACHAALVTRLYYEGRWWDIDYDLTVRQAIDRFLADSKVALELIPHIPPIEEAIEDLMQLASDTDWRFGLRCGRTGRPCKFCKGVPCQGSEPLQLETKAA